MDMMCCWSISLCSYFHYDICHFQCAILLASSVWCNNNNKRHHKYLISHCGVTSVIVKHWYIYPASCSGLMAAVVNCLMISVLKRYSFVSHFCFVLVMQYLLATIYSTCILKLSWQLQKVHFHVAVKGLIYNCYTNFVMFYSNFKF